MAGISFKSVLLLSLVLIGNFSDTYKLLVVFPFPSKSHGILGEGYVTSLIRAGHEVTYIAAVPLKKSLPGLRQIDVSSNFEVYPLETFLNVTALMEENIINKDGYKNVQRIITLANATITNEGVQRLMMDPQEHFDAVIAEWMFTELYSGFANVFGCPLIWSSSMEPHGMVLPIIDEDPNPLLVHDMLLWTTPPYSFQDRVNKLLSMVLLKGLRWYMQDQEEEIFSKGYGPAAAKRGVQLPTLEVAKYQASLMLGNSHVFSGLPISLPQSYKPIGGYHIEEKTKPLPEEWQKIMDEATHGVIYFSLGSMLKSKQIPDKLKRDLLNTFGDLKQTVIWKFEEVLPDLPKNVHIVKWAPQPSILAHPNCILFITHGGLLSTTETLHYGVPVIGIPMYADQYSNINGAETRGFGKRVILNYDVGANLKVAIEEMLGDPRYRDTVKHLSFIYHHRPATPRAELVHWVEHVIKTKGAPHLRSPALQLPLYQKLYLDLAALILATIVLVVYTFKFLFKSKKIDINKKNK